MKEKLFQFVINNPELEKLESKIKTFNPFSVLKIENYEIRHSNVLGWLLDPNESHGLGDFFFKKVVSQIILENEEIVSEEINLLDIHLGDFNDSIMRREEKNIDILVRSPSNNLLLLIENKIHATESEKQLKKYLDYAKLDYKEYKLLPVLLTKNGDEPKNDKEYCVFSHQSIYTLLTEVLALRKNFLPESVLNFIKFYLQTLKKTLGMDEELKKLCQQIYDGHKEAIDLIIEMVNQRESSLKPAFEEFEKENSEIETFVLNEKWIWFLPKNLLNILPTTENGWLVPHPIGMWISRRDENRLKFHIEVGPFKNGENRLDFMLFLERNGYKVSKRAKRIESRYTRIYTKMHQVKDWTDQEELYDLVSKIIIGNKKEFDRLVNVLESYEWKI